MVATQPFLAGARQLEDLDPALIPELIQVARAHGLEAWLAAVAPLEADPAWRELAEQRPRFLAAQSRLILTLREIGALLTADGHAWCVLKGPSLAYGYYPRPDLRHSVDLDLLIDPRDLGPVLELLQKHGYQLNDRNWPMIEALMPGELSLLSPRGFVIDLHWSVMNDPRLRRAVHLPTARLLSSRRPLPVSGVVTLGPAEQLVHVGLHAATSGANKLQWLLDVHQVARTITDWDAVVELARESGTGLILGSVIRRAGGQWPSPIAEDDLRRLGGGPAWRALDAAVAHRSPLAADPSRPSVARSWSRSIRANSIGSVREFVTHGAAWVRAGRPDERQRHLITDPHDRRSVLHSVADDAAQNRYLAQVASVK